VAGGPIIREKTFFFVDYQGTRQLIGRVVTSTVPTLAERDNGGFFKTAGPAVGPGPQQQQCG
jgi:hypothetical protein